MAQEVEQVIQSSNLGGLIPGSSSQHVKVSLEKILNPKSLPTAGLSVYFWLNGWHYV